MKETHTQLNKNQDDEQQKVQYSMLPQTSSQFVKFPLTYQADVSQNTNVQDSITEEFSEQNEQHTVSLQSECSDENQISRLQQTVTSSIVNQNVALKPLCALDISSGIQQSLKLGFHKSVPKTIPTGQKLIVVSSANSILQRTLTIPFVKNVSIKNFDKFKIVVTTTAPTSTTSVISSTSMNNINTYPVKHKVVTLRTNPSTKKVSLSHLQVCISVSVSSSAGSCI